MAPRFVDRVVIHARAGLPEDFGRSKSVAWYGILKFDIPWDTANVGEAKSIHVTSLT